MSFGDFYDGYDPEPDYELKDERRYEEWYQDWYQHRYRLERNPKPGVEGEGKTDWWSLCIGLAPKPDW